MCDDSLYKCTLCDTKMSIHSVAHYGKPIGMKVKIFNKTKRIQTLCHSCYSKEIDRTRVYNPNKL
jgi:hypothetical protein